MPRKFTTGKFRMLYLGWRPPCRKDERYANIIVLAGVVCVDDGYQRTKHIVTKNSHVRVMHHIADLALIGNGLYRLGCFYRMKGRCLKVCKMLVRKNHGLPCYKADQNDPGKTDMELFLFQVTRLTLYNANKLLYAAFIVYYYIYWSKIVLFC
jgi:hypothetical protein